MVSRARAKRWPAGSKSAVSAESRAVCGGRAICVPGPPRTSVTFSGQRSVQDAACQATWSASAPAMIAFSGMPAGSARPFTGSMSATLVRTLDEQAADGRGHQHLVIQAAGTGPAAASINQPGRAVGGSVAPWRPRLLDPDAAMIRRQGHVIRPGDDARGPPPALTGMNRTSPISRRPAGPWLEISATTPPAAEVICCTAAPRPSGLPARSAPGDTPVREARAGSSRCSSRSPPPPRNRKVLGASPGRQGVP